MGERIGTRRGDIFSSGRPGDQRVFSAPGEYVLVIRVRDAGNSRSDSTRVVVLPENTTALPTISFLSPGDESYHDLDTTLHLQVSAREATEATIEKVAFYEGSRKIGEVFAPDGISGYYEMSWTPSRLGGYSLSAMAMDLEGRSNISSTVLVMIKYQGWFSGEGPYFRTSTGLVAYNYGRLEHKQTNTFSATIHPGTPRTISNSLVMPGGSLIWRNGRQWTTRELCGNLEDWSTVSAQLVSPEANLLAGTAVNAMSGQAHAVLLLPVEMKITDRDDPTRKWGDEKDHNLNMPIYAGESTGDMVSWKLSGTDSWTNVMFTWMGEGPGGETVTGPTGAGKNEWTINDADGDMATDWLNWKPGEWKIKVQIGSSQAEFEQEVGWRTEDYVVIGQIVETHAHDGDAPPLVAVGDNWWEISSPVALYRRAVLYDMLDLPVFDGLPDAARDTLMITPLPITAKLTEAWFGYWYLMPSSLTPKGPFAHAHPSGNGNVEYGHRFWATQHIFNVSPDAPPAPETFTPEGFNTLKDAEQYRVIHRYKSKFLVTSDGKIDSGKVVQIEHVAEGGPTKMNFGIAAGEFSPIWNNPAYTFFSLPKQPSETNQYQGAHAVSQDGTKLSCYATGRVGAGGQNVNWRLMGKDAPWIFSEIITELKSDRTVAAQIKTSVDKSWSAAGGVQGETAFNNLNLYKLQKNLETDEWEFIRQTLMPMEGELEDFINSASGQRPEPPIPPSVQ